MCQYIPLLTSWLPLDCLAVDSSTNKYRRRCTRNTFKSLASTVCQLSSIYVEVSLIPLRGQDIAGFFGFSDILHRPLGPLFATSSDGTTHAYSQLSFGQKSMSFGNISVCCLDTRLVFLPVSLPMFIISILFAYHCRKACPSADLRQAIRSKNAFQSSLLFTFVHFHQRSQGFG